MLPMEKNISLLKIKERRNWVKISIYIFLVYIAVTLIQLFYGIFSQSFDIRIILVLYSRFGIGCIGTLVLVILLVYYRKLYKNKQTEISNNSITKRNFTKNT